MGINALKDSNLAANSRCDSDNLTQKEYAQKLVEKPGRTM